MIRRLTLVVAALVAPLAAAQHKPVFIYEQLLDTYFDDSSGLISFGSYDIAFAPEAPLNAAVAVVDSEKIGRAHV